MKVALISIITVGLVAIASVLIWQTVRVPSDTAVGVLTMYQGSVAITRSGAQEQGETGAKIMVGDTLATASSSRAAVTLADNSIIRLDANSVITVNKKSLFTLQSGQVWSSVQPLSAGDSFAVETPTITAAVRGTEFNVSYVNTISQVYLAAGGPVGVNLIPPQEKEVLLQPGEIITISASSTLDDFRRGPMKLSAASATEWFIFNQKESAVPVDSSATTTPSTTPTISSPKKNNQPVVSPPQPTPLVITQPTKKITSLALQPTEATVTINQPLSLSVIAQYSDDTQATVTGAVSWSQFPGLGLIDNLGNFRGAAEGTTKITASLDGTTSNAAVITIKKNRILVSLEISYKKNAGATQLPSAQFALIAVYSDDSRTDVTKEAIWLVTGGTAKGRIDSAGLYTASGQGRDTVQGAFSGLTATTVIDIP